MSDPFLQRVEQLFATRGASQYGGEAVTQLEHALQAAEHARTVYHDRELVVAALLHDVGHLLHNAGEDCAKDGIDDHHEELGYRFLAKHFGPEVTEPIRLHVPAKRYLCATEPSYFSTLSPASVLSLSLQGGVMNAAEVAAFEQNPHHQAAIHLRRCDDFAKVVGHVTPPFAAFLPDLEHCLVQKS